MSEQRCIPVRQERELGLVPDAAQASRRDAVRKFVEDRRADAAEQQRFMRAVERLRVGGDQAATRAAGASTLTLPEAEELQAKFDDNASGMLTADERARLASDVGRTENLSDVSTLVGLSIRTSQEQGAR